MASYLIVAGHLPESVLPVTLYSFSAGLTQSIGPVSVFHISTEEADPALPSAVQDLNLLSGFAGTEAPWFRPSFSYTLWQPELSFQSDIIEDPDASQGEPLRLLTSALYGSPCTELPHDALSVQWAMTALLHTEPEQWSQFLTSVRSVPEDEQVRIMVALDLCDDEGTGIAFALVRALRAAFPGENAPLIAFSFLSNITGADDPDRRSAIRDRLRTVSDQELVRPKNSRTTSGADMAWLFGLPASCRVSVPDGSPVTVAFARVCARFFSSQDTPDSGYHTVSVPGILSWDALGDQAMNAVAFFRASVWLLTDLLPAVKSYLDKPSPLLSLAPSPKNALFRKLTQNTSKAAQSELKEQIATLTRVLSAILVRFCAFVRALPDCMRDPVAASELWTAMVNACGEAVTLGASYDVAHTMAVEAGLDKVMPVHRGSMADTEEERSQRRLNETASRLSNLENKRSELMTRAGGFRARQALEDCLHQCISARDAVEKQYKIIISRPDKDNESVLQAAARLRSLNAAVDRTRRDLRQASSFAVLSAEPSPKASAVSPWSGQLLDPVLAPELYHFLTEPDRKDDAARKLRDELPRLISGYNGSDTKTLLRAVAAACIPDPVSPFSALLTAVRGVALTEAGTFRPVDSEAVKSAVPPIPLLPDLTFEGDPPADAPLRDRVLAPAAEDPTGARRGLLAMLLLMQYRRRASDDPSVIRHTLRPQDGAAIAAWLEANISPFAEIISLQRGPDEFPMALILPGKELRVLSVPVPAVSLIPSFVLWFDRGVRSFVDPCVYLSESGRTLLTEQLTRLRSLMKPADYPSMTDFLSAFHRDIMNRLGTRSTGKASRLSARLKAACGLPGLKFWPDVCKTEIIYEKGLKEDLICACLSGLDHVPAPESPVSGEVLYTRNDIPFARESASSLFEPVGHPEEEETLDGLESECKILLRSSDTYHENLRKKLKALTEKYPDADASAASVAASLLSEADEPVHETVTEFAYPWADPQSAAYRTILSEALSPLPIDGCEDPFSQKLAVIPRQGYNILGDTLVSGQCVLPLPFNGDATSEILTDAVLPPFSPAFASLLCENEKGRLLLTQDMLSFAREGESIQVSILLHAAFDVRLTRTYTEDQIVYLYSDDIPTLSVWPAVPFASQAWKAYFSFAHMQDPLSLSILSEGRVIPVPRDDQRWGIKTEYCPSCYLLEHNGVSLAACPNLLPSYEVQPSHRECVCVDYGSSGISVVLTSEADTRPLNGTVMVRTLLRHPQKTPDILRNEFLPALPVTPIFPAADRIFRNAVNQDPVPFVDGTILMPSSLKDLADIDAENLYASMKWGNSKGRSSDLCLHQVMLLAAFEARVAGASSLCWRFAIPDGMAAEGRSTLVAHLRHLAQSVSAESGLPAPQDQPQAGFVSESEASGAYFRFCMPERTQAGFMILDIGSCSSDLTLFLRGHDYAVRCNQMHLGIQYMLLPSILADPALLQKDYGTLPDETLQQDLSMLTELFTAAQTDAAALRKAGLALDTFIADHSGFLRQVLSSEPMGCQVTRSGSLLLLGFAWLMTLAGVLLFQLASDPLNNDFLPDQFPFFLSGRGSGLLESMTESTRGRLRQFLCLCKNSRVSTIPLCYSTEKKMEIAFGLSRPEFVSDTVPVSAAPSIALPVKPYDLICYFLLSFLQSFPGAATGLFPGWFSGDPWHPLTEKAERAIDATVSACFAPVETPRPFDSLVSCLSGLLEAARL